MNRALFRKCVIEARLLWAALALLLFAFCWVRVYIVSRLRMSQFAAIVEQLWDQFKDFSPVPLDELLSYTGRIAIGYNEPVVVVGVSLFAIARGSDVVSGELGRGTLELLLAQPVSRLQVLAHQAIVTVVGVLLLAVCTWGGTTAGIYTCSVTEEIPPPRLKLPGLNVEIPLSFRRGETVQVPMRERTDPRFFLPGAVNLACLGVALAGLSTLASAMDRYRWRTIGVVVGTYVVMLVLKLVGQAIHELPWLKALSLFTAYEPQKFISLAARQPQAAWWLGQYDAQGQWVGLGPVGYDLVLLGLGAGGYLAAAWAFCRRDLPAPL
jgi:ABC-2 type transport system permease protein